MLSGSFVANLRIISELSDVPIGFCDIRYSFLDFLALCAAVQNSKQQSELLAYQKSRFTDSRPFFPKMPKNEMSMISKNASAVHKESTL